VWTAAGEFEAYLGRFTGRAIIGVQGASIFTGNVTDSYINAHGGRSAFNIADYFHDQVEVTFYPLDDLAISAGHIYSFNRNAVTGEVEYLLPQFRGGNIAPSAFFSAAYGWDNSSNIMAGIRVYFGNHDKTLIRRQREDDPKAYVVKRHTNGAKISSAARGRISAEPQASLVSWGGNQSDWTVYGWDDY